MEVLFFVFFVITWGLQAWILIDGGESFRDLRGRVQELKSESLENGFKLKEVSDDVFKIGIEAAAMAYDLHSLRKRLDKAPAARLGTPQELREILDLRAELADTQEEERHWREEHDALECELAALEKSRAKRDHTTEQARTWAIEDLLRKGLPIDETVRELRAIDNEHGYGAWK